jgi:hypothetical protein
MSAPQYLLYMKYNMKKKIGNEWEVKRVCVEI